MRAKKSERFLTTREAAQLLRLSYRTLEDYRLDDTGPAFFKVGSGKRAKVLYNRAGVLAWLKRHSTTWDKKR